MRSERVVTHETCNQRCGYCTARRSEDDRAWIATRAVAQRIADAAASGAEEIVFTGGEPTMREDLPRLVEIAKSKGISRVVLETNGTLVTLERARALRAAGLDVARVNLAAWGAALDAVTEDPGGFARTLAGVDALVAAGVAVEIAAAVVRPVCASLPALPEHLVERFGTAVEALVLRVPSRSPDASLLISYADAAAVLERVALQGKRVGLAVRLAPEHAVPPCVFPRVAGVAHLFAMTAGVRPRDDHRHLDGCAACAVRDRCAGFDTAMLDRFGAPEFTPVREDRVRRRLSVISSVREQVARELVQLNRARIPGRPEAVTEALVRVNFHCNQACAFCFVSTHLPSASEQDVRRAIEEAGAAGHWITLSGGEPTLHPGLATLAALAASSSAHPVGLQTNATRLTPASVAALGSAGIRRVFVSLHASHAALSDAITDAPGTFDRTLAGLDALHAEPRVELVIPCVVTHRNHADLTALVRLVATRWPRAAMGFAFVAPSSDMVPRDREMIPRYAEVVPSIAAAVREAQRLGVACGGFESMCGVPLCLVPADVRGAVADEIPDGFDRGEFVHPPACASCTLRSRCYGVRRGYLDLYGDRELRAVACAPSPPNPTLDGDARAT